MDYKGLKVCQDNNFDLKSWDINHVTVDRMEDHLLVSEFGRLGWGGNSGFHAINLAVQFGVEKIILVGYDMTLENGVHWHGSHTGNLNDPNPGNVARWRNAVDAASLTLAALKIEVVNTSIISKLRNYPKMSLERALADVQTNIG